MKKVTREYMYSELTPEKEEIKQKYASMVIERPSASEELENAQRQVKEGGYANFVSGGVLLLAILFSIVEIGISHDLTEAIYLISNSDLSLLFGLLAVLPFVHIVTGYVLLISRSILLPILCGLLIIGIVSICGLEIYINDMDIIDSLEVILLFPGVGLYYLYESIRGLIQCRKLPAVEA